MAIETIKDKNGYVISYCEYFALDKDMVHKGSGEYIYVVEIWQHPTIKKNYFNYYIQKVLTKYTDVRYVYWVRHKYDERASLYEVVRGDKVKLKRKEIDYGK